MKSKGTLVLENPIRINGTDRKELTYDASQITALQFSEACAASAAMDKTNGSISFKLRENDYALHMYLGFMAVIAVNSDISIDDMERAKGNDILRIANIGMLFTLGKLEDASTENNYENTSENTPDTSTPA